MRRIAIFLFLIHPFFVFAQNESKFEIQNIQLSDKITKYEILDLNGDSLKEIIVFTQHGKGKKTKQIINILWQTEAGFSEQTIQSFTPKKEIILFDFGDVTPDLGKEFVFLTKYGVYYYQLKSKQEYDLNKKILTKTSSIFKNADQGNIFYWDFVKDINDDNKPEILIPQFNNYLIFARTDSNGWTIQSQLRLPSKTNISSFKDLSVSYRPIKLYFADCNSDGLKDILARDRDEFSLFYQKPNGSYPGQPDLTFDMQFHNEDKKRGENIDIHHLKDMNGDGLIDMLAMKISARESVFNPQSQIQIYFGKKNEKRLFALKPDQIIVSSGIQVDEQLLDFNNDKRIDLAVPSIKLGLMRIIKMLLTKSVTMGIKIYQMNELGNYPEQPNLEKSLTLKFSFSMDENSAEAGGMVPVFDLEGDFNGDKYLDLISAVNQKKFNIYYGSEKKVLSDRAKIDFDVQLPKNGNSLQVNDLDNNGKSDIIIIYRKSDDKSEKLTKLVRVLMNRM